MCSMNGNTDSDSILEMQPMNATNKNIASSQTSRRPTGCIPQRFVFAALAAIGNAITYGLKVNLHVSFVTMVNYTALSSDNSTGHGSSHGSSGGECAADSASESGHSALIDGPFPWDSIVKGVLYGAYFYGYLLTQVVGGRLAELVSAKYTFGISLLVNVVLAILSPSAAYLGWPYLVAVRVLQGMAGGVTLPTTHVLVARWAPLQERSKISSIVYAGMSLGTVVSVPLTGLIAGSLGWEMSFYIPAALALIPTLAWFFLIYETPEVHPWISESEKELFRKEAAPSSGKKPSIPWLSLLKSKPFWAILISHTFSNFGWYLILTELPFYMSSILGFDIKSNALLSSIPFLVMWLYSMVFGSTMDSLASRGVITRTQIIKIATAIAAFVPAVCLLVLTHVGCNRAAGVVLLTVATGAIGSMYSGFLSNHISISPVFAGTLMAITNTVATLSGMIVPSFVGAIIHKQNTLHEWSIIFGVTSGLFVLEGIQYIIFASAEEEPWSKNARAHSTDDPPAEQSVENSRV